MTLVAIIGELGSGKTLSMTWLMNHNFNKGRQLYANYHLKPPLTYNPIKSIEEIEDMKQGVFGGDELWLWLDSRASRTKANRAVSMILAKSRKRGVDIIYTTQSFRQIDVRIRNITDFIIEPRLNRAETLCRMFWYSRWDMSSPIKIKKFYTPPFFKLYDTTEEIDLLTSEAEDEKK